MALPGERELAAHLQGPDGDLGGFGLTLVAQVAGHAAAEDGRHARQSHARGEQVAVCTDPRQEVALHGVEQDVQPLEPLVLRYDVRREPAVRMQAAGLSFPEVVSGGLQSQVDRDPQLFGRVLQHADQAGVRHGGEADHRPVVAGGAQEHRACGHGHVTRLHVLPEGGTGAHGDAGPAAAVGDLLHHHAGRAGAAHAGGHHRQGHVARHPAVAPHVAPLTDPHGAGHVVLRDHLGPLGVTHEQEFRRHRVRAVFEAAVHGASVRPDRAVHVDVCQKPSSLAVVPDCAATLKDKESKSQLNKEKTAQSAVISLKIDFRDLVGLIRRRSCLVFTFLVGTDHSAFGAIA